MENLPILELWKQQQKDIASKVSILSDDFSSLNDCPESRDFSYYKLPRSSSCSSPPFSSSSSSSLLFRLDEKFIGGVDVSFPNRDPCDDDHTHGEQDDTAVAVYVIIRNFQVIYQDSLVCKITQPYISSFLAFREIEPIQTLINRQKRHRPELTPHVILVDGNGILHERKAGLATFVGVTLNIPTIGVGKSLYCMDGLSVKDVEDQVALTLARFAQYCSLAKKKEQQVLSFENQEGQVCIFCKTVISPTNKDGASNNDDMEGSSTTMKSGCCPSNGSSRALEAIKGYCVGLSIPIRGNEGKVLGAALVAHGGKIASIGKNQRCGTKNPIYVSIGHGISLQEAVVVCCALSLARVPEPIRQADLIGRELIKKNKRL
mmetsp:Transcript_7786/g.14681  ORF Transcript_7786/g.14681 Transcript_7786/m.14681 type:complete len:375 (-) Transcript_7786:132-1256(-)